MSNLFKSGKKAAPVASVPPPVATMGEGSSEIEAARRSALARARSRRGFASSIRGGETGSGTGFANSTGQRSLLGL